MNYAVTPTVSFSIFKPNSTVKVDTLKYCFIKRLTLKTLALPSTLTAEDGIVYNAVYDSRIPLRAEVDVIVSFQAHTFGNFAVIRVVRDHKEPQ